MAGEKQIDKFKAAARELGMDTNTERFKERLGKLVKQKPAPEPEKPE